LELCKTGDQRAPVDRAGAMDLVDLVLTFCLLANPQECKVEHHYFENRGSLMACMFLAPSHMAKLVAERPGYRIAKWRCEYPGTGRDI
jgi:hypothetical protein